MAGMVQGDTRGCSDEYRASAGFPVICHKPLHKYEVCPDGSIEDPKFYHRSNDTEMEWFLSHFDTLGSANQFLQKRL